MGSAWARRCVAFIEARRRGGIHPRIAAIISRNPAGASPIKAALYARFSTDLQRATSIEDQFRNCRKRADVEGWEIVAKFADQAMSGSDASRPQYQAMLNAAMRNEFDVLIVDDLSRLTRDAVEAERAIRRLEFNGIRIISTCAATTLLARHGRSIVDSKD